jgi:hypothetical protein
VEAAFSLKSIDRYTFGHRAKPVLKGALESRVPTISVTQEEKGFSSVFKQDVISWMREGVLCEMARAIERPAFMDTADFVKVLEEPDWLTWSLLTLDLFKRHALNHD